MTVSRYQSVGTATYVTPTGEQVPYLRRRFLPAIDDSAPVRIHLVPVSELHRPDLIAASELGDAELSWLLADANPVARPSELCQEVGQAVRIPLSAGMDIGQSHGQ